MLAVTWIAAAIVTPLSSVLSNGQRLQLAGAQLQRLADVLQTEPERPSDADEAPRLTGRIDLVGVGYRYDPAGCAGCCGNVSLSVWPGQRVAVVGRTGVGEDHPGYVAVGVVSTDRGRVAVRRHCFAGVAVGGRYAARSGWYSRIRFAFSGTIRQNIAFHDPDVAPGTGRAGPRGLACLHEDITAMPLGYDTRLAERGAGLSGGQRQRLSLARALVRRPGDPAFGRGDQSPRRRHRGPPVPQSVRSGVHARSSSRNRLSTIRDADQIVVLDQGSVGSDGNP